jgi:hypothetical protein
MIPTPEPDELNADLIAIDVALDALAQGRPTMPDPALAALAEFAHAIDTRAAALGTPGAAARAASVNGQRASRNGNTVRPAALPGLAMPPIGRHTRTRPAPGKRLSRIVLAVAVAAVAVLLASALPFSGSPSSPLHPLHQLIFQPDKPTVADDVRLKLASASEALDHANDSNGSSRAADLEQARRHLAEAREQLVQVTDPGTRSKLETELSNLEQRATRLSDETDQHGGPADTTGPGQNERHGDGSPGSTTESTNDPNNGQAQPTASPHDTHEG